MHYRADDVRRLASEFARFGEVVAGSEKEHHLLEVVRSLVEDYADKIVEEPVPVTTWREELCTIEAGGKIYNCSIQPPYNGYIDAEFSPSQAVVVSLYDLRRGRIGKNTIYGRVVVVDVPRNPDDIADAAIELLSMEPSLIIFSDPVDSLRRIVVLDKLIELYEYAAPPKTPVITVPRSSVRELLSNDAVRVLGSSIARESYGYNLVAWRFGGGDNSLYIAAHHDHWFQGASDDVLGVAIAVELFRKPPTMWLSRHGIALALFTAEEGFPEKMNSFYWLVGSRHFVSKHFNELVEELLALVNIDVVCCERVKIASSNPWMLATLHDVAPTELDSIFFDSFSFTQAGLPALTLHALEDALHSGIYHTSIDTVDRVSIDTIERFLDIVTQVVKSILELKSISLSDVEHVLVEKIIRCGGTNINVAEALYSLFKTLERCSDVEALRRVLNLFTRIATKVFAVPDVETGIGVIEKTLLLSCPVKGYAIPVLPNLSSVNECFEIHKLNLSLVRDILSEACRK